VYNDNLILRLGHDRRNLFDGIELSLPFRVVLDIEAMNEPASLGGFAEAFLDGLLNLSLCRAPLLTLLDSASRHSDPFH